MSRKAVPIVVVSSLLYLSAVIAVCLEKANSTRKATKDPILKAFVSETTGMTFVRIAAGTFTMGSPRSEQDYLTKTFYDGERPDRLDHETQHEVTLTNDFFIGVHEVTVGHWKKFVADTGFDDLSDLKAPGFAPMDVEPTVNVSWDEAQEFIKWISEKDRRMYRLPTEAEWEYSCRGGRLPSQIFGVGDGMNLSSKEANFDWSSPYGSAPKDEESKGATRVGKYAANGFGLFDMHGNVSEWCSDWYAPYPVGAATNPTGPPRGLKRVYRGGGWKSFSRTCRSACRSSERPSYWHRDLGFRLVAP